MSTASQIGFYLPYGWNESTYVACYLADLAMQLGVAVSFRSSAATVRGVHDLWDDHVRGPSFDIHEWAADCSHIVWFSADAGLVKTTRNAGCSRHILAVTRSTVVKDVSRYDHVVVMNSLDLKRLQRLSAVSNNIRHVPFSVVLTTQQSAESGESLLCFLEPSVAKHPSANLVGALNVLKESWPTLELSVLHDRSWPPASRVAFKDLHKRYNGTISTAYRSSFAGRMAAYAGSGCVLSLGSCDGSAVFALEAMYCGRPVIALDCEPGRTLVRDSGFGWLVPCRVDEDSMVARDADIRYSDMLACVGKAVAERRSFQETRRDALEEALARRHRGFTAGWKGVWEV